MGRAALAGLKYSVGIGGKMASAAAEALGQDYVQSQAEKRKKLKEEEEKARLEAAGKKGYEKIGELTKPSETTEVDPTKLGNVSDEELAASRKELGLDGATEETPTTKLGKDLGLDKPTGMKDSAIKAIYKTKVEAGMTPEEAHKWALANIPDYAKSDIGLKLQKDFDIVNQGRALYYSAGAKSQLARAEDLLKTQDARIDKMVAETGVSREDAALKIIKGQDIVDTKEGRIDLMASQAEKNRRAYDVAMMKMSKSSYGPDDVEIVIEGFKTGVIPGDTFKDFIARVDPPSRSALVREAVNQKVDISTLIKQSKYYTSPTLTRQESAGETIEYTLPLLEEAVDAYGNGKLRASNAFLQHIGRQVSDPKLLTMKTFRETVATEVAKYLAGGGQLTVDQMKEWRNNLDTAQSPEALKSVIVAIRADAEARKKGIEKKTGIYGKPEYPGEKPKEATPATETPEEKLARIRGIKK